MKKYIPAKEWLKAYNKYDKNIIEPDKTIYNYPENHLNFLNAEKYLNKILKLLKMYGTGYDKIIFQKSQPCIYNIDDHPYFWSYSGIINIYKNDNCNLNKKTIKRIKKQINKLNIKYEYICKIIYNDKNIESKLK